MLASEFSQQETVQKSNTDTHLLKSKQRYAGMQICVFLQPGDRCKSGGGIWLLSAIYKNKLDSNSSLLYLLIWLRVCTCGFLDMVFQSAQYNEV